MKTSRAFDAVVGQPWAIEPSWLPVLAKIAQRGGDPSTISARPAAYTDETCRVVARDGVALLELIGPVFPRANMLTEMSGATSLQKFSHRLTEAVEDASTHTILITIDSPGGVAFGVAELADMIRSANERKPIIAYVSGMAASAAYWIAAAAGKVYAHRTALIGSIGVVIAASVQEEPDSDGYRHFEIVSSNAPAKRPDMSTDEGIGQVRGEIDALEAEFISSVAAYRGVSTETVISRFGGGGCFTGAEAMSRGMIDGLSSFEEVLAGLAGANTAEAGGLISAEKEQTTMSKTETTPAAEAQPVITIDGLKASHPDIVAALRTEGATAERERILGVEQQTLPGHEALIASLKADGKTSPEEAAVQILAAEKKTGARLLQSRTEDDATIPAVTAAPIETAASNSRPSAEAPVDDRARYDWDKDADLRADFADDFDQYLAYVKAVDAGKVKVMTRNSAA
jgi:ClpP class serine protease